MHENFSVMEGLKGDSADFQLGSYGSRLTHMICPPIVDLPASNT